MAVTYIVEQGDNLSSIAKKFGMTEQELMKENNINPNREYIYAGDAIKVIDNRLPEVKAASPLPDVNNKVEEYIVQKGDTYYSISNKYKISSADLMELNNKDPFFDDLILPGDKLKVIDRNHAQQVMADCTNDTMSGTAGCPLNKKIAIVPMRYAIDEAPDKKGGKSHKPLPKDWVGSTFSPIKTRSYTMRQLRDGWLYIWNGDSLEEYQVKGNEYNHTARQDKTLDDKFRKDGVGTVTTGEKGTKTYLELPTKDTVFITYSEERWTENYYERISDNKNNERKQFMRELNIPDYLKGKESSHTGDVKKLADYVSDIDKSTVKEDKRFDTTMVQSKPSVSGVDKKAIITDNSIISKLPDNYHGLVLALDDHLGILHDLTLQLTGRNDELMQFNEVHQHRLYVAEVLEQFCSSQLKDKDYPSKIANTKEAKRTFTRELEACLVEGEKSIDIFRKTRGSAVVTYSEKDIEQAGLTQAWENQDYFGIKKQTPNTSSQFREKYPDFTFEQYKSAYAQWDKANKARKAVKYDEAMAYLDKAKIRDPLIEHIEQASTDITTYLTKLGADPLAVFLDNTFIAQSALLTSIFTSIHQQLSMYSEKAQEWLANDLSAKNTLITLIPYNFSKPLALGLEKMAKHYEQYQQLEANEKPFDGEKFLSYMTGAIGIADGTKSTAESFEAARKEQEKAKELLKTAITYDRIKETQTFQNLPPEAQQAYLVFPEALKASTNAWEGWQRSVLYRTRTFTKTTVHVYESLSISMIHLVVYGQVTEEVNIQVSNANFKQDMEKWVADKNRLKKLIATKEAEVGMPKNDKKAYQEKLKSARRKMSYRKGMNPVVKSRLKAKDELAKLRQELADLEQSIPVKHKITGFFKKTTTNKIMDIHIIKMIFKRLTVVETTTFTQTQAAGYVYTQTGRAAPAAGGMGGTPPSSPTQSTSIPSTTSAANDEGIMKALEKNGIGVIGVILVGLNAINVINTIAKPIINGQADKDDIQSMIIATSALTSLLFSFKTNQLWGVVSQELIPIWKKREQQWVHQKLIEVSRHIYGERWSKALGGTFEQQANQFLKLGAAMSVFGLIANAVETWQIKGKIDGATNTSEMVALYAKAGATGVMGLTFGAQFMATTFRNAWLGKTFGPWAAGVMLVASIVYLAADYFASLFRYEGFDLWCSRCIWSNKAPYWPDTEQGNKEEIRALQELLMAPQLVVIPRIETKPIGQMPDQYIDIYVVMPPLPNHTSVQLKLDIGTRNVIGPGSVSASGNNIYQPQELIDLADDFEANQQWVLREDFEKQCELAHKGNSRYYSPDKEDDFAKVSGSVDISQLVWFSRGAMGIKGWSRIDLEVELYYPPELLAPRIDKRGYLFKVDMFGNNMVGIHMVKPENNTMENSKDTSTYTVKKSSIMAVEGSPYQLAILPPLFTDEAQDV